MSHYGRDVVDSMRDYLCASGTQAVRQRGMVLGDVVSVTRAPIPTPVRRPCAIRRRGRLFGMSLIRWVRSACRLSRGRRCRPGSPRSPTPMPARYPAPSAVVSLTAERSTGILKDVRLKLHEKVVGRRAAIHPERSGIESGVLSRIASSTSRVW